MSDQAIARTLDSYLGSSNPTLRAQGQYLQSGRAPQGYSPMSNGMVHADDDMRNFMDKYGWLLMAGLPAGGFALGSALAPAALPSIAAHAGVPAGLPGGATVAGGAGTAGAAAGAAHGGLMAGFGVKDALQLGPMIAGLFTGHGGGNQVPQSAELEQILGMQRQRMQQTDPLYQAMIRMAMGLLPVSARAGMQMPGMPPQAGPMPPQLPGARVR
jgi:hypothetical protein